MKVCNYCKKELKLNSSNFHRNKNSKTGFNDICKKCRNEYRKASYEKRKLNEYALYKGEELLHIGTMKELAEVTGLKKKTLHYYHTPTYKNRGKNNRKILIKVG